MVQPAQKMSVREAFMNPFMFIAAVLCIIALGIVAALFSENSHNQNKAYENQWQTRVELLGLSPEDRKAFAAGMLAGDAFADEEKLDPKLVAMLKHVKATGEIPTQQTNRGPNKFWHSQLWYIWLTLAYLITTSAMLASIYDISFQPRRYMWQVLAWRRVWPVCYVLFMLANPLALIGFVVSVGRYVRHGALPLEGA